MKHKHVQRNFLRTKKHLGKQSIHTAQHTWTSLRSACSAVVMTHFRAHECGNNSSLKEIAWAQIGVSRNAGTEWWTKEPPVDEALAVESVGVAGLNRSLWKQLPNHLVPMGLALPQTKRPNGGNYARWPPDQKLCICPKILSQIALQLVNCTPAPPPCFSSSL